MKVLAQGHFFGGFVSSATAWIEQTLVHFFGPGVNTPVLGRATTADLCAAAVPVLLGVALNVSLVLIFHRQARKAPHSAHWRIYLFGGVGGPVYFFVWLGAIYFCLAPFLLKWWSGTLLADVVGIVNELFKVAILVALFWLCLRLTRLAESQLDLWAAKIPTRAAKFVVPLVGRSLRGLIPVMVLIFAWPLLGLSERYRTAYSYFAGILIVGVIAWILAQAVDIGEKALLAEYDIKASDNLRARKIYTQARLISRTAHVAIAVCAVASILMLVPAVRQIGASMLASAGIAGIVAGIAAQKTLANLIAGFQIALAQPLRQDDVVIVESEWGRIEEITLTYVVVHIWDDRRMVLPLTYFIEKPFQNWTRNSAALLGSVFVWVDYTFPVEDGRQALKGIIENHPLWDKRFWNLQVSDCDEKTMQLRVLATAADSSKAWDLRCAIREQFIAYIQKTHPQSLPRVRAEIDSTIRHSQVENSHNREAIERRL